MASDDEGAVARLAYDVCFGPGITRDDAVARIKALWTVRDGGNQTSDGMTWFGIGSDWSKAQPILIALTSAEGDRVRASKLYSP